MKIEWNDAIDKANGKYRLDIYLERCGVRVLEQCGVSPVRDLERGAGRSRETSRTGAAGGSYQTIRTWGAGGWGGMGNPFTEKRWGGWHKNIRRGTAITFGDGYNDSLFPAPG